MQKVKKIKGMSITPYFGKYWDYGEVGDVSIKISNDHENWESIGIISTFSDKGTKKDPIINYIRIIQTSARYIKITCKNVEKRYLGISSVNVYE